MSSENNHKRSEFSGKIPTQDFATINETCISAAKKHKESQHYSQRQLNEIESTLIQTIAKFWKEERFIDALIYCEQGSECIKTHALILRVLSPFLRSLIEDLSDQDDVVIMLPDVKSEILKSFLHKVYHGSTEEVSIPDELECLQMNFDCDVDDLVQHSDESNKITQDSTTEDLPLSTSKKPTRRKRRHEVMRENIKTFRSDKIDHISTTNIHDKNLDLDIEKSNPLNISTEEYQEEESIKRRESKLHKTGQDFEKNDYQEELKSDKLFTKRAKREKENKLVMFSKSKGSRTGTPSIAWNFFEMISTNAARCLVCESLVTTTFSSTSGLLKHLKVKHLAYCEKWEKDNVKNFDPSILNTTEVHPIRKHFQEMEKAAWSCCYCDTVFLGIDACDTHTLDDHLREQHSKSFSEYELDKVGILCRRGKENRNQCSNMKAKPITVSRKQGVNDPILIQENVNPYLNKGLSNVLAKDFFTNLDREMLQCRLCLGTVKLKVPSNPNSDGLSLNLWKHLKISHFDIHEKLEIEKAEILEHLKLYLDENPIWKYFKNISQHTFQCLECNKDIMTYDKSVTQVIDEHISSSHHHKYTIFHHEYKEWDKNLSDEVLSKFTPGIPVLIKSIFTKLNDSSFKCNKCEELVILNESEMLNHITRHHESMLNTKIKSDLKQLRKAGDQVKIHLGECFCVKCDRQNIFASATALDSHNRYIHLGERPYPCDQCTRTFIRSDELKLHKRYHQDRDSKKGAMCSQCGMVFNSAASRIRHENTVHYNIRRHSCSSCGKKFASTQALERHSRIHSDVKPHQCSDCGQQFREIAHLKVHYRTHSGEKPISCPNCSLRFKHYAGRRSHKCEGIL